MHAFTLHLRSAGAGLIAGILLASTGYALAATPAIVLHPGEAVLVQAATLAPNTSPPPAATATPMSSATTSPLPSATPLPCPASLQAAVDSAPAGSTLDVRGCIFHEAIVIGRSITLLGGTVTGDGVRLAGVRVTAPNVTLDGLTVTDVRNALQTGALEADRVDRLTLRNVSALRNAGAGLSITGGSGSRVSGGELAFNVQEGYHFVNVTDFVISGVRIHDNNPALSVDPGWEAGGGKVWNSHGVTFGPGNEVYANGGPGIWFDGNGGGSTAVTVVGNRVHHNTQAGIMYEVSSGPTLISGNFAWENGWQKTAWGWGAGILVSTSRGVTVADNTLAWNADGISVASQDRPDNPGPVSGITVRDNLVAMTPFASDGSARYGLAWLADWSAGMFTTAAANHASNNGFWWPTPESTSTRFEWNRTPSAAISQFAATPGGVGSAYRTSAQVAAILSASGMPAMPMPR